MMDVITYVNDLLAFRAEAIALVGQTDALGNLFVPQLRYDAEDEALHYGVSKIPVHYSGAESLTLIRIASDAQLQHFNHMTRLGVCADGVYVFDSPEAQATYERVRGNLTFAYLDENGEEQVMNRPYEIGIFL